MRRPARIAVALATSALTAVALGLVAPLADAAELGDAGWWWRFNPGGESLTPLVPQATLPPQSPTPPKPPDVPAKGLLVERAPDGASAIGAVRFALSSDESSPVLELKVERSSGTPQLLACQAGSAWSGAEGGRWDSKPLVACDAATGGASVAGVAGPGTFTFNLSALALKTNEGSEVDVIIVPANAAGTGAPFRVVFGPVGAASLKTEMGGGSSPSPSFDATTALTTAGSDTAVEPSGLGSFEPSVGTGSTPVVEPALPPSDQGLSATAPVIRNRTQPAVNVPVPGGNDSSNAVGFAIVLAAGATAYALSRQRTPLPAGLVPLRASRGRMRPEDIMPVATTGGLGRFARPRTGMPVRLGG